VICLTTGIADRLSPIMSYSSEASPIGDARIGYQSNSGLSQPCVGWPSGGRTVTLEPRCSYGPSVSSFLLGGYREDETSLPLVLC